MQARIVILCGLWIVILTMAIALFAGTPALVAEGSDKADFGRYPAKERKEALFRLCNKGDRLIRLLSIRTTCGCAVNELGAKELQPGESTSLKTVVIENGIFGPYSKNVYVESDDPAQKFLSLSIAGNAVPIVYVKPQDKLSAGRIQAGAPWKQEFLLEASEDGVLLGEPLINANLPAAAELNQVSNRTHSLSVTISPPSSVSGDFLCKLSIPVKKPEGWIPISISISGQAGLSLMAVPAQIIIPANATEAVKRTLELKLLGGKGLGPEMLTFEKPEGIIVEIAQETTGHLKASVTVPVECFASIKASGGAKLVFHTPNASAAAVTINMR